MAHGITLVLAAIKPEPKYATPKQWSLVCYKGVCNSKTCRAARRNAAFRSKYNGR